MTLDINTILSAIESHAASSGHFERVNMHEPKNALGNGLTCAIWVQSIDPVPNNSGLTKTTARIAFTVRIYSNMLQEPEDMIDPNVISATESLMNAYSGDFELGGNVRNVDLLGQAGNPMAAVAGYLNIGGTMYRVMDIALPLIVNDVWTQAG